MEKYNFIESISKNKLWIHFEENANDELRYKVKQLVIYAATKLSAIRETFPSYTIHDGQHQYNMMNIVELLLGERVKDLSSIESAFLVLSIYYHDIGMVYSSEELNQLSKSKYFNIFLRENISAAISFMQNGQQINDDLAEWFCRWNHAVRVHDLIKIIDTDLVTWENIPIGIHLGLVCESHNWSTLQISSNPLLHTEFLGSCDLKFVSMLLRLADILDFDYTRAPKSLYQYLNLNNGETFSKITSKTEWRKHMSSNGFTLSSDGAKLIFSAGPKHPDVEYSIRQFLTIIDIELYKCNALKSSFNKRWQNFSIPKEIDKDNIISNDYLYGDFELSLAKEKIFEIFIGENLYQSKSTFIRELLQNAIDTTRHRVTYERYINHNLEFKTPPIVIEYWKVNNRYSWFKISDNGMGMDLFKIQNYFLKVGNSYYTSLRFEKFVYDLKLKGVDFLPISRFGIGFLSCFMVSDEILVSTFDRESESRYCLEINPDNNYYILKTDSHNPLTFPDRLKNQKSEFKCNFGTSIYLKVDRLKYDLENQIENQINSYYCHSSIPLIVNDKLDFNSPHHSEIYYKHSISEEMLLLLNRYLGGDLIQELSLIFEVKEINKITHLNNVSGTVILSYINSPNTLVGVNWNITLLDYTTIRVFKKGKRDMLIKVKEVKSFLRNYGLHKDEINSNLKLSYNGIAVPLEKTRDNSEFYENDIDYLSIDYGSNNDDFHAFFNIELFDQYRPELFITRESLKPLSWKIYSALSYIVYSVIKTIKPETIFDSLEFCQHYIVSNRFITNQEISQDILVSDENYWPSKELFYYEGNYISLKTLKNLKLSTKNIEELIFIDAGGDFEVTLPKKLLEDCFNVKLNSHSMELEINVRSKDEINEYFYFPPLMFIDYNESVNLYIDDYPINKNHKISKWIIENSYYLNLKYKDHFGEILDLFRDKIFIKKEELISSLITILNYLASIDNNIKKSLENYSII